MPLFVQIENVALYINITGLLFRFVHGEPLSYVDSYPMSPITRPLPGTVRMRSCAF